MTRLQRADHEHRAEAGHAHQGGDSGSQHHHHSHGCGHDRDHAHEHEPLSAACCDHTAHDDRPHANHAHDGCCTHDASVLAPLPAAAKRADGMETTIRIMQMDCPTEEALIRGKLDGMECVTGLDFNLMQRTLTVVHAP